MSQRTRAVRCWAITGMSTNLTMRAWRLLVLITRMFTEFLIRQMSLNQKIGDFIMNILNIVYIMAAACIGLFSGMVLELMLDTRTIRELQDENRNLRHKVASLEKENKIEVVEIIDDTVGRGVDFSQKW